MSKANKHHYVPQFYLRQFSCSDDIHKVPAFSLNQPFIIKGLKSIEGIAYEDNLYSISNEDVELYIEDEINKKIETPITQSETWEKIRNNKPELINESDKLTIYLFIRHIESRNIEFLQFIRNENKRIKDPKYAKDYSELEHEMHSFIDVTTNGSERYFLEMTNDVRRFLADYKRATITIIESRIPIRTSTNPVVVLPESMTFREGPYNATARWLPLSPRFGAILYMSEARCDFYESGLVEDEVIKALNRLFIVQLLNSQTVRHMIADDTYLSDDFLWAGIENVPNNIKKFKIQGRA